MSREAPDESSEATWFPLPADHLLHLIEYNVFKGLVMIKAALQYVTVQYRTVDLQIESICDHTIFPMNSVIIPLSTSLPDSLTPTSSQMNILHSAWINLLPFPAMRDNLIKHEYEFDHSDFVKDLVGEQINLRIFLSPPTSLTGAILQKPEDEPSNTPTGLVVWGEPHLTDSWEATPGFLKKWAWAVRNCRELVNSTNRWRETRGEEPLVVDMLE